MEFKTIVKTHTLALTDILWAVVLSSAILVMNARDNEQQETYKQIIILCNETGQHCPDHLRGE